MPQPLSCVRYVPTTTTTTPQPSTLNAGVWPEFALLNHSCAPNTVQPVLLQNLLLLRAASGVPAGEELTTSYLGLAGACVCLLHEREYVENCVFLAACLYCDSISKGRKGEKGKVDWSSTSNQLLRAAAAKQPLPATN